MCGRFVLSNFMEVKGFHNVLIEPSYNIAPSHCTLIINQEMSPDFLEWGYSPNSVSYTHLTLPTILLV